ncbi:MAG TPA: heavy metal translocating P-type ATPase [Wenzhouxiangella sp.]
MSHRCSEACWHCGEAIPQHVNITAPIQGVERPMCCHGCQMVASLINESGLDRYYDFRDALPKKPVEKQPCATDYSAWDRDRVLKHHTKTDCDGLSSIHLVLENVHCSACAWLIQRFLKELTGIVDVAVDTSDGRALIRWDQTKTALSTIAHRLAQIGYVPHLDSPDASSSRNQTERRQMLKYLVVSGLGMMQVMSYALAGYIGAFQGIDEQSARFFQLVSMMVAVPVALYAGQSFYKSAWTTLKHGRLGMDVPVSLAILIALTASILITFFGSGETYFDSVVMFIFFLLLGRYAVMVARQDAGQLHSALARSLPSQVSRLTDHGVEKVGLVELEPGNQIQLGLGETLPADGVVTAGTAHLDESLLSGEAKPCERRVGDAVLAGTQVIGGHVVIEITKTGQHTALADVIRLLDQARHFRPQSAKMADQIAGWFIGFVLLGALMAGLVWWSIDPTKTLPIMLSILVVSCPCALALGTPVALASAARGFAKMGLLINTPDALETLPKITHVVFDKTGTLTESTMAVAKSLDVQGQVLADTNPLTLAARLERISQHPIASAFAGFDDGGRVTQAKEVVNQGVSGIIDGVKYVMGKPAFIAATLDQAVTAPDTGTWVALANDTRILSWFLLDNPLRHGAQKLINALKARGHEIWLASGDQPSSVEAVAQQLGITQIRANCSPDDKLQLMQHLQDEGACVVMIGDGINDAPILARANVSMSLADGADIARTQANIVMTGQSLENIHGAFRLAPKVRQVIQQNLTWAIAYNLMAFPLAAFGWVPPWAAAIGMSASSLLVVLNGRRAGSGFSLSRASTQNKTNQPFEQVRSDETLSIHELTDITTTPAP